MQCYQDVILSATISQTTCCTSVNRDTIKYGVIEICNKYISFLHDRMIFYHFHDKIIF